MNLFSVVDSFFHWFSQAVPLEVFVFSGSLIEEIVSPIPSTLIMGIAGSMALADAKTVVYLFILALFGNVGKMIGAFFYYVLGDKLEDLAVRKIGRFFGVTHAQVEGFGVRLSSGWKGVSSLFLLRAFPFVPTTPVSLACGVVRMPIHLFIAATFFGNFVKDLAYLFVGYMGLAALRRFFHATLAWKYYADLAVALGFVALLFLLWYHRKKGVWLWERARDFFYPKR